MRLIALVRHALCASLILSASALAAEDPPARPERPARPARPERPRAGGVLAQGGPLAQLRARDRVAEAVQVLAELNLSPDFTLTPEQKTKLKAIREEHRKAMEAWRQEHEADIRKLEEEVQAVRRDAAGGGGGAEGGPRAALREVLQAYQDLLATAPKADKPLADTKAILTPEQLKAFEERLAEREQQREQGREQLRDRVQRGAGGADRPDRPARRNRAEQ